MTATVIHGTAIGLVALACELVPMATMASAQMRETVSIRGHNQSLRVYGTPGGMPVIISSGDGGWIHLGPHVAEVLAANGCFVVGFDVKAYLESFTAGSAVLRPQEVAGDYQVLVDFATRQRSGKVVLVGVSEGAGLSVLAASDSPTRTSVAGVIGLGLPDLNELGWHWQDALIYFTHDTPHEPTFSTAALVDRLAPLPLALVHSTRDEFVPLPQAQHLFERASEPKRMWVVNAANHRFSDNIAEFDRCLLEAITWISGSASR